ncbi:MAG: hypothetical protein N3F63_02540 [Thermoplasmata archaeon]|nr:hypothetical protein [Thermoplasmata archaeon]
MNEYGDSSSMGIVSVEMLAAALREKLKGTAYEEEDIGKLAEYIMSFFGFEDRIIDNMLNNEDRDMFYFLEDNGILRSGFEDTTVEKGKPWRIHYWILNKEEIFRIVEQTTMKKKDTEEEVYALYDNPELWKRGEDDHESQ